MKTKVAALLFPVIMFYGCNGQTTGQKTVKTDPRQQRSDSLYKPDVRINVSRKYDEKGNVIRYDSSYSYAYTFPRERGRGAVNDSVMKQFRSFFGQDHGLNDPFSGFFRTDSLFRSGLFDFDHFFNRSGPDDRMMQRMHRQMDSLRQNFFRKDHQLLQRHGKTI